MKKVLIVAKCIVNSLFNSVFFINGFVLIVAKCIVNLKSPHVSFFLFCVLIVAKCIVNQGKKVKRGDAVKY